MIFKTKEKLKQEENNLKKANSHMEGEKNMSNETKEKITFKEKLKKFIKNKKAVAMVIEYILTIECFTMLFLLTSPTNVKAAVSTADENGITWYYTISNGQAINVYYASGTLGETVTIPSTLSDGTNEYPVVSLYYSNSYNIFKTNSNTTIKNIIIPSSVTSIGDRAFLGCTGLISLVIGNSVTSIGNYAFYECTGLANIEIPDSVTSIGPSAFYRCTGLTSIEIPDSVTSIGNYAFYYCTGLTSVRVGNSVTSIGSYAFSGCTGLTSIEIPNSVTSIGNYAFYECTGLTSIEIPSSVTSIGSSAFSGCTGLTSIEIPSSVTSIGQSAFRWCTGLTCIEIPNSVTSIGSNAFSGCSGLTEIEIPNSVTSIGGNAFNGCTGLTDIEIPDSVTSIGNYAFYNCIGIKKIIMPGTASIGNWAFLSVTNLEEVVLTGQGAIPDYDWNTVQYTPWYQNTPWYQSRNKIQSITIGEGITTIGSYAFLECTGLTKVTMPGTASIGNWAFLSVTNLEEVVLTGQGAIPDYDWNTVQYTPWYQSRNVLQNITIGEGIISIGNYAFYNNVNITEMSLLQSIVRIGESAFSGNTEVFVDNLEENVECSSNSGGIIHFLDCMHSIIKTIDPREHVTIEDVTNNLADGKVQCKGTYSFRILDENNKVKKDKTVRIEKTKKGNTSCETREEINPNEDGIYTIEDIKREITIIIGAIDGDTAQWTNPEDGITYEYTYEEGKAKDLKYVSGELGEIEALELPERVDGLIVTSLASEALKGQTGIKEVIIPDSIVNIGQNAFEGCTELETITLSDSLQVISNGVFKGCSSLEQVELPDELLAIGNEVFSGCSSLRLNQGLKSVRAIGQEAFKDCTSLTGTITLPGEIVQIGQEAFSGCTGIEKIIIAPYEGEIELDSSSILQNSVNMSINGANIDNSFMNSISFGTNTENVMQTDENGEYIKDEFGNNIPVYILDENGDKIPTDEYGNYMVLSVTKTTRDLRIGDNAFSGCSNLTELRVYEAINKLDANVISQCPSLTDVYITNTKGNMLEELEAPEGVYVHYLDTTYEVETSELEGTSIEDISGISEDGKVTSEGTYKFKVNIAEGANYKGVVVKVGNAGEEKEVILPDEDGVYTIKNVIRDQEIEILEGRIVEVRYVLEDGSKIAEATIIAGEEGSTYQTTAKEIENYKWNGEVPENAEGVFTEEEIVVIYVYEKIPSGVITVKYVDKNGKEIADKVELQGYIGDKYEILRKNISGYKAYGVTPENAKGTYTAEDIEVIFVYEAIEEETVVKYVDENGNYIARDKTVYEEENSSSYKEETAAKDIEGYENPKKEENGKEITYTYEEAKTKGNKWTTEQTLLAIAGMIAVLTVIFIIIAKREKNKEEE